MSHSYRMELSTILTALPLAYYAHGPVNAIRYAYRHGYANRLWPRASAVRILFLANMESAVAVGSGNAARRRADKLAAQSFLARVGTSFDDRGD